MNSYRFHTNCVACPGPDPGQAINDMIDTGRTIKRATFLKYVDREVLAAIEADLGYDRHLPMSRDWHVSYARGIFRGRPAAWFTWSAIEYVFLAPEVT